MSGAFQSCRTDFDWSGRLPSGLDRAWSSGALPDRDQYRIQILHRAFASNCNCYVSEGTQLYERRIDEKQYDIGKKGLQ